MTFNLKLKDFINRIPSQSKLSPANQTNLIGHELFLKQNKTATLSSF